MSGKLPGAADGPDSSWIGWTLYKDVGISVGVARDDLPAVPVLCVSDSAMIYSLSAHVCLTSSSPQQLATDLVPEQS